MRRTRVERVLARELEAGDAVIGHGVVSHNNFDDDDEFVIYFRSGPFSEDADEVFKRWDVVDAVLSDNIN